MTQSYRDAGCKGNTNIKNVTLKGERYCQDYTDVGGYDTLPNQNTSFSTRHKKFYDIDVFIFITTLEHYLITTLW